MKRFATACTALIFSALVLNSCAPKEPNPEQVSAFEALVAKVTDEHSYAKPNEARVTHVDLDLNVDFASKRLSGTATLTLQSAANAHQVVLDTKSLEIDGVTDASGGALKYSLGTGSEMMGKPLTIELPQGAQKIIVHYKTTQKADALQWLDPSQTAGKAHPFLFSQGESIFTRTWIPTQDSPSVRQTYRARIVVPKALSAVMSAKMLTPNGEAVAGNSHVRAYRFDMEEPIAPYLIALAVGDIAFAPISHRTGVYAEKVTLDKAAYEFVDLEKMLVATEKLYGPYRWGRYDVLVLPPSFPFGGMENPRLTFATPTILAGDRSLVSLVAHEMAHSWSGNLVTNATWEDFWLNEGFTSYIENRVMEELYGKNRAMMLQVLDYDALKDEVKTYLDAKDGNLTRLHQDLTGIHPDDAYSQVPYEKGAGFLRQIERVVGRKKMDNWLKGYFKRHAFKSMTTEAFLLDIEDNLIHHDPILENQIQFKTWLYGEGLPSQFIVPRSDAFTKVDAEVSAFVAGADPQTLKVKDYSTQEWIRFIQSLPKDISLENMKQLDDAFGFTKSKNSEIGFAWLEVAIARHYEPAMPALRDFVTTQGRRKFILPLFKDLMAQKGWGVEMAKKLYAEARPGYHALTRASVDSVVK